MITIKSGRHPLAVSFLGFLAFSGISNLIAYSRSASGTVRSLPGPVGPVLFAGLACGSLIAIAGVFMPGLIGPMLERAGLSMLGGFLGGYAILAVVRAGWPALFVVSLLFGMAVGCVLRIVQIGRELQKVRVGAVRVGALDELGGRRERWGVGGHLRRWQRSPRDDRGPDLHPSTTSESDSGGDQDPGGRGESPQ